MNLKEGLRRATTLTLVFFFVFVLAVLMPSTLELERTGVARDQARADLFWGVITQEGFDYLEGEYNTAFNNYAFNMIITVALAGFFVGCIVAERRVGAGEDAVQEEQEAEKEIEDE